MPKTALELIGEAMASIDHVTPAEAYAEAQAGVAVLLDVREPVEWEHHIAGAVQVPRGLLEFAADPTSPRHKAELDPAARVIVFCRSGARSSLAAFTLQSMGYERVANLDGGFSAWAAAGLPTADHHEGM